MANKPTLQDTLDALKIFTGKKEFDAMYDVSGDGKVDLTDVLGLQKAYAGKDPGFAFSGDSFSSPSTRTAADYAAEEKANQERIAAEQKETERRQALLADAQKMNGLVTADLVANNPNLTAQQLSSLAQKNYWSNESEAFSRVMTGMENGTAKLKEVEVGADEWGTPITQLALTTGERPGFDTLYLRPTNQEGVYQFSTYNQKAGGNIHGIVQADPKTGQYAPIQDYTKQIQYTPGSSGGFFGNVADAFGDAIGSFGDIYKSLGPIAPIIGNALAPGLGSALSAAAALDEGNTSGAILSGLSAAGSYGNAALQAGDTTGLGGTLAENLPEIKTATSAAQLANAVQSGNVGSALNAAANLTGVSANEDISTALKAAGLVQALDSGNIGQTLVLAGQLTDSPNLKVAGDAVKLVDGINSGNFGAVQNAATSLAKAAGTQDFEGDVNAVLDSVASKTTSDAGGVLNSDEVVAGTQQLIDAITNPQSTVSYPGTQVADVGRAGDPGSGVYWDSSVGAWRVADEATDEDLEQLGVGVATGTDGAELTDQDVVTDDGTTTGIQDVIDTITGGDGTDTITGGQDSVMGGEATTQGGDGTDTLDTTCADGFHWDDTLQICVADTDETQTSTDCQDGYVYNVVTQTCEPITTEQPPAVKPPAVNPPVNQQPAQPSAQQPALTQQESPGLGLTALLALMGGGDQQAQPAQPALADTSGMVDIEELLANPLQTDYRNLANKPKMAEGGSIDDLLALLNQKG